MKNTKKNIYLSLLVAIGLVLSIVESSLPSLVVFIPGMKLGFSNIVILTAIVLLGFKESILIAILKSLLLVVATGNVTSIMYGLPAGIFSAIMMNIFYNNFSKKIPVFSLIGVSIIGSISHNFAQITMAVIILGNVNIYTYLPLMSMVSLVTGYFVGLVTHYVTKNLEQNIEINGEIK